VKIEITWNKPDGTTAFVGFQTQLDDPNRDDEEMQVNKSMAGAQAYFHKEFGVSPLPSQLKIQVFSVNFKFLDLSNPRLKPEVTRSFLNVGQLVGWELPEAKQTYTGLLIVGEKTIPEGFQTMVDCTMDNPPSPVPLEKAGKVVQTVLKQYQERGVVSFQIPGQA
jgi:hypothetical protein